MTKWLKIGMATLFYLVYVIPAALMVTKEGSLLRLIFGGFYNNCSRYGDYGSAYCLAFGIIFAVTELLLLVGSVFATLWYARCLKSYIELSVKINTK